jgi:hypothetical protein
MDGDGVTRVQDDEVGAKTDSDAAAPAGKDELGLIGQPVDGAATPSQWRVKRQGEWPERVHLEALSDRASVRYLHEPAIARRMDDLRNGHRGHPRLDDLRAWSIGASPAEAESSRSNTVQE